MTTTRAPSDSPLTTAPMPRPNKNPNPIVSQSTMLCFLQSLTTRRIEMTRNSAISRSSSVRRMLLIAFLLQSARALSAYQSDTTSNTLRFYDWLEAKECEGIGATELGWNEEGLRGVFARESYDPGEYVLAVPNVSCLKVYEGVYDPEDQAESEPGDAQKGQLLANLLQSQGSQFQPYFDILPTIDSNFDPTPDFWDENTIRGLQMPMVVKDTLALKTECSALCDELQFSTWLIRSRGFSTFRLMPDSNETRLRTRTLLIPYLDCINHSLESNCKIEKVESKNDDESFFALVSTRPIEPSDQITITYGTGYESSLDLFVKYGFWIRGSPHDRYINFDGVEWTTTIQEDESLTRDATLPELRQMLDLRTYLKELHQNHLDETHDSSCTPP